MADLNSSALTAEEARNLFRYDEESGRLFWAVDRRKVKAGQEAGTIYKGRNLYRQVSVNYKLYRTHRIIWLMLHGQWPDGEIDHIDGDGMNNRIANLRDVSRQENSHNMKAFRTNSSGCIGVRWHSRAKKWQARIHKDGKDCHIGLYETKDAATAARKEAEKSLNYHENHGRHPSQEAA